MNAPLDSYQRLLHEHLLASRDKQDRLLPIVGESSWNFDLAAGELTFTSKGFFKKTRRASVQLLGSWSAESSTWLWAWEKRQPLPERLLQTAFAMKALGEKEDVDFLATGYFEMEEEFAHAIAAIACGEARATGYYRCPNPNGSLWVLMQADWVPEPDLPLVRIAARFPEFILMDELEDHQLAFEAYARWYGLSVASEGGTVTVKHAATGGSITATFDESRRFLELNAALKP